MGLMRPRAKLLVAARCRLLVRRLLAAVVLGASLAVLGPLRAAEPDDWIPAAVERGERFLEALLDPAVDLLPEYRGARVYWLYHDNYLAARALAWTKPDVARRIETAIERHGVRGSGKIEIVHGEAREPLPFRVPELVTVASAGGREIRTERLLARVEERWEAYADLLLLSALARAVAEPAAARRDLDRALAMWDEKGLLDPAVKPHGIYSTYKLALLLVTAQRLGADLPMRGAVLARLRELQSPEGGWITDYMPDGSPSGLANVETTCLVLLALEAAGGLVRVRKAAGGFELRASGELFCHYDPDGNGAVRRPFFSALHAPGGIEVTRPHPPRTGIDPTDHADMHPGLWMAFGSLGGRDFWRNDGCCRVEHVRFTEAPRGGVRDGGFTVLERYVADGETLCDETCRVRIRIVPAGILLMVDSELEARVDLVFGDQQEMGFGVRLATPILSAGGGRLLDSEGRVGEKEIWGREAAWCDGSGVVSGCRVGVALFAHPANERRSRVHARDHGLIVLNPFGRRDFGQGDEQRVPLKRGERMRLRFAAFFHSGPAASSDDIEGAYQVYARAEERSGG
jgi:hypothetical protein